MINSAELLDDVVKRLRVVAPELFPDRRAARATLERLAANALVETASLAAVAVRRVGQIATFRPDQEPLDYAALAGELHRRWAKHSPTPLQVFWSSKRAIRVLGGEMSGQLTQLDAVTHDLGVSAVALKLFDAEPSLREAWIPEERFPNVYGRAKADAALGDGSGIRCLIEFCGRYTAERLARLARLSTDVRLPIVLYTIDQGS